MPTDRNTDQSVLAKEHDLLFSKRLHALIQCFPTCTEEPAVCLFEVMVYGNAPSIGTLEPWTEMLAAVGAHTKAPGRAKPKETKCSHFSAVSHVSRCTIHLTEVSAGGGGPGGNGAPAFP